MLGISLIAAVLLTPPGTPEGGFHWQRIITPPPNAGLREACVVLDAATFANAAPALRDLRLFQDGTELAYVIEESYDERALNSGTTPEDDRSEYESGASGVLQPVGASNGTADTYQTEIRLDGRVPVERLQLDPAPAQITSIELRATTGSSLQGATHTETVQLTLRPGQATAPVTLGANLQSPARVLVLAHTGATSMQGRVLLQMRRRSLCYQPRSASPLMLYLGGGQGIAAKVYGLADSFSTAMERPYATMGPLEPNPDLQHPGKHSLSRLLLAGSAILGAFLLTLSVAASVWRREKGRPKATPVA